MAPAAPPAANGLTKVNPVTPMVIGSGVVSLNCLPPLAEPDVTAVVIPAVINPGWLVSKLRTHQPLTPVPALRTLYIPFCQGLF